MSETNSSDGPNSAYRTSESTNHQKVRSESGDEENLSIESGESEESGESDFLSDDDLSVHHVPDEEKTPFVILLGYLGAGKTTLVNYILKEQKDKRICVIENEFGAVSIDDHLVSENVKEKEDILTMENGCVCCTVRGDLVNTLLGFADDRKVFDFILLETTGLADPSPIVSTFNQNPEIDEMYRIDSVVCVVDAKHIERQLSRKIEENGSGKVNEAAQQIAFADRILLNKTDLVNEKELKSVKEQISSINMFAEIILTEKSRAPLDKLIGLASFNIQRTLELLENEIEEERMKIENIKSDDSRLLCHDENCKGDHEHSHQHGEKRKAGDEIENKNKPKKVLRNSGSNVISTRHNNKVGSIALTFKGSFSIPKFNEFIGDIMSEKAQDIFRCKGVLSFEDHPYKFVFQGVHEQIVCEPSDHLWPDAADSGRKSNPSERDNKLVFIGYDLNKKAISEGFKEALIDKDG